MSGPWVVFFKFQGQLKITLMKNRWKKKTILHSRQFVKAMAILLHENITQKLPSSISLLGLMLGGLSYLLISVVVLVMQVQNMMMTSVMRYLYSKYCETCSTRKLLRKTY